MSEYSDRGDRIKDVVDGTGYPSSIFRMHGRIVAPFFLYVKPWEEVEYPHRGGGVAGPALKKKL